MTTQWKAGDWVVFERRVGQVKKIGDGWESFSDGMFETSGQIASCFRPLTLQNKTIAERFEFYYDRLNKIDGSGGFNWPDISWRFSELALQAMDEPSIRNETFELAREFVRDAQDYRPEIQGIKLFRRNK